MGVAVNCHALPVYKKNRIASLLCIFEATIMKFFEGYSSGIQFTKVHRLSSESLWYTAIVSNNLFKCF